MNLERIVQNKYIKSREWLKEQKLSFLVYILAFILLVLGAFFSSLFYTPAMFALLFALLYDIAIFLDHSHNKYWEKFIYIGFSILAYFSYLNAEALAKLSIYTETGVKAEYFGTALAFFKGIYFVPSIILIGIVIVAGMIFILLFLSFVPMYANFILKDKEMVKAIRQRYAHTFLFLISSVMIVTMSLMYHKQFYESFFNENFIASWVLKYEFVPNRSCANIPKDTLIKLLDGDNILVSNIKQLPLWSISEDENATFTLKQCKR